MFKKLLPFLLIPVLLFSSEIKHDYYFGRPQVRNNVVYMKGCLTARIPFSPCVPSKHVTLLLPHGEKAVSFSVKYDNPILIDGEFDIGPFQPGGRIGSQPPRGYYSRRSEVYEENKFYPYSVKSPRFVTHYKNGHPIFIASIYPVQYNPISGKLQYYNKITVSVQTETVREKLPVVKFTPFIKGWLTRKVDNPEALSKLSYTKRQEEDYDYLIVTMSSLENSFDEYIEFNKRRAMKTKLVTIDEVISRMSGRDNPEKLKNYIKQEYENCNITYVLLGGDEEYGDASYIPHKGYFAEFCDYGIDRYIDSDIAADQYYETLDGDELDDLEWDVYAARFAVDDNTELQNMISKTIKYSEEPDKAAATKALMLGEYAWPNINGGSCYSGNNMDQIIGECNDHYSTSGIDNNWTITKFYERDGNNWSGTDFINEANKNLALVNHAGHSNNFMVMNLNYSTSQNDMTRFTNTFGWIGYTHGCYCGAWDNRKISKNGSINTGHYSQDCIAEGYTAATANGAVAFLSMVRYGLGDDGHASEDATDGSSIRFQRYFHDAAFGQNIHHIAMMHAYSKEVNEQEILNLDMQSLPYYGQMRFVCYEANLLGDPALSMWTKTPQDLSPDYPTTLSGTTFEWDTKNSNTWVAFLDGERGNIISNQLTGTDGICKIDDQTFADYVTAHPNEKMIIRVKAHNYLPHAGEVQIPGTGIDGTINEKFKFSSSFNSSGKVTQISYTLPVQDLVTISLYNSKGTLIKIFVNENQNAGNHSFLFKSDDLSNGIYYCRLKTNNTQCTNKFFVTK